MQVHGLTRLRSLGLHFQEFLQASPRDSVWARVHSVRPFVLVIRFSMNVCKGKMTTADFRFKAGCPSVEGAKRKKGTQMGAFPGFA